MEKRNLKYFRMADVSYNHNIRDLLITMRVNLAVIFRNLK